MLPSVLNFVIRGLESVFAPLKGYLAVVAQPAHGVATLAWRDNGTAVASDILRGVLQEARKSVQTAGGNLTFEQCPVAVKVKLDQWGSLGGLAGVMRRLKAQYDPGMVLNPGRFIGGI